MYLRTAPIDPRDLFRGDYVSLRYEASTVPLATSSADIAEKVKSYKFGDVVYTTLAMNGDLAETVGLSPIRPASGTFLKGRLAQPWRFDIAIPETAAVEYGIEAYFVPQGKGVDIEKQQGMRNTIQVPLEMEIAVGSDGTALIRGHRLSTLGIGLQVTDAPAPNAPQGRKSAKLRLTLKNASKKPLALVNLPAYCSFFMEQVSPGQKAKAQDRPECSRLVPTDNDVVVTQPGEALYHDIDLAEQPWLVIDKDGKTNEASTLDWNERFRIVYRPPSSEAASELKDAAVIWHGRLPSRAFHGRGNID